MKEKSMREKRFVLKENVQLENLWSNTPQQILTLTYTYSPEAMQKTAYVERVEMAVETFNKFGLARLVYEPLVMPKLVNGCPLDLSYLKKIYKNQIIFTLNNIGSKAICAVGPHLFYILHFAGLDTNSSDTTLQPFSSVSCNIENSFFLRYGPGVLLHELNHLFGIEHTHFIKETNGILMANMTKPDIEEIFSNTTLVLDESRNKFAKMVNIYAYFPYVASNRYTLTSPFSIQHYPLSALEPYKSINKTRIGEIFDSYASLRSDLKSDYFYLLDKYAGHPLLYTYQDLTALAQASYSIAPDSMAGLTFSLPTYYLVEGIYIPSKDEQKLTRLIENLRSLEGFTYPILAQQQVSISVYAHEKFSVSLYDHFKIVGLSKELITCHWPVFPNVSSYLKLYADCLLKGESKESGTFSFNITILNNITRLQREVTLVIKKRMPSRNRVLLGIPHAKYELSDDENTIDFIALCQAIAVPRNKVLHCTSNELSENYLSLENCMGRVAKLHKNFNMSVIFVNSSANKTCHIQILNKNLIREVTHFPLQDNASVSFEAYPFSRSLIRRQIDFLDANNRIYARPLPYLQQISHIFLIPLLQGFFEGIVDFSQLGYCCKNLLKLLPRAVLLTLGYTYFLSFSMTILASLMVDFFKEKLENNAYNKLENGINLLLFLVVTELEYAPSRLWKLTGQLEFFPETINFMNKLFVQMALAPAFKTAAYLTTQGVMKCLSTSAEEMDSSKQQTFSANADFFNALSVARSTVFSKKILRPFAFFSRPAANNQASEVVEEIDAERSYIAKIA